MFQTKQLFTLFIGFFLVLSVHAQSAGKHISKAKKHYGNSNYTEACFESIKALKINPKKKKAQEILSFSYEMAVEDIQENIEDLKAASMTFENDRTVIQRATIVNNYKTLNKLDRQGREIHRIVKNSKFDLKFERIEIGSELVEAQKALAEAKESAAEMHYSSGVALKEKGGVENNKAAAKKFKHAMTYVPNFKQSQTLYEEAKRDGTTRIAIFAFENKSGETRFGAIGEQISDQLASQMFKDPAAMEFVEIVSRDELAVLINEHNLNMSSDINAETTTKYGKLMGVHRVIVGKVTQISSENQPRINQNPYKVTKRVKVGTETYINNKGKARTRSVYNEVAALAYEHQKFSKATINGSYKVLDVETGKLVSSKQFNENYVWENKWITWSGDERAYKSKSGYDRMEKNPPTQSEMGNYLVNRLATKISNNVITVVR